MATPTMKGMEEILREFKESVCDGVCGIVKIDGPKPGPILGITACTHGNEPSGLSIFYSLLHELSIKKALQCGTLYLVVNNIAATEAFFACMTEEEWSGCRFVDINMNRLPRDVLSSVNSEYELVRARELYPIWKRFTHGLDIHSTLADTSPMIISRGNNFDRIAKFVRGFPIKVLISNIDVVQIGVPAFAFYGANNSVPVFAIEAGQHTKSETFVRAKDCTVALLQNLGMLPGTPETKVTEYQEYEIAGSVVFSDMSFDFIKDFKHFDEIRQGDLLARNKIGEEIFALFDGQLIMPTSKRGDEKDVSEEASFVSLPMEIHRVS